MSITATFVKDLTDFTGEAKLWKLSEEIAYDDGEKTEHVITSATDAMFSGPETYIFLATPEGEVISYSELPGSFRGGLNHHEAISGAGWRIAA